LFCHIRTAGSRLLKHHELPITSKIPAAIQAVYKLTDFDDLVRAVDIFLGSAIEDDKIQYCLREIEWGIFAGEKDVASWINVIGKYPGYAAEVLARQSEVSWENFHVRERKQAEQDTVKRKSIVET